MKKIFYSTVLLFAAFAFTTQSCSDILESESDLIMYEKDNQLNSQNDTLYSVMGAIHLLQQVADRTNILGEVRGDLVSLTSDASTDLQELASFTAGTDNAYNRPQDYYAIINNCNYFIANADTAYRKHGSMVFERELAVMHSYRAWAYMQLGMIYGEVPFYTHFLGTQAQAQEVMQQPKKNMKEMCNLLVDDLLPWATTKPLIYDGSFNGYSSEVFNIPVKMLLGELCLWAERYNESAQWYHDFLADVNNPHPVGVSSTSWFVVDANTVSVSNGFDAITNVITRIPMETNVLFGTITQLPNLYTATTDNYYHHEIEYSQGSVELSASQRYIMVYTDNLSNKDTLEIIPTLGQTEPRANGDLRLYTTWSYRPYNNSESDKYNDRQVTNEKIRSSNNVVLYRIVPIYLHFAEALNRAGFPTAAFSILKYGLCNKLTLERAEGDPIAAGEREMAGTLLDFPKSIFTESNTMGIHSRGCGDADANPLYVIPALPTAADTTLWVEDCLIDEMALETQFEGHRYYDLMRVALRRGDASYLADRVAARNGKDNIDALLKSKLLQEKNWYLPLK